MSNTLEQRLQETLDQLPWLERSCLLLSINTDLTLEEIADILDVTKEEVNTAILQSHQQFRHTYYRERETQSHTIETGEKEFPLEKAPINLHYVLPYAPVTSSEVIPTDGSSTDNAVVVNSPKG